MSEEPNGKAPPGESAADKAGTDAEREPAPQEPERPVFQHPQWLLGVVLVFAVIAILAGLRNPVWFLIGFPAILVLAVWLFVQWRIRTM